MLRRSEPLDKLDNIEVFELSSYNTSGDSICDKIIQDSILSLMHNININQIEFIYLNHQLNITYCVLNISIRWSFQLVTEKKIQFSLHYDKV